MSTFNFLVPYYKIPVYWSTFWTTGLGNYTFEPIQAWRFLHIIQVSLLCKKKSKENLLQSRERDFEKEIWGLGHPIFFKTTYLIFASVLTCYSTCCVVAPSCFMDLFCPLCWYWLVGCWVRPQFHDLSVLLADKFYSCQLARGEFWPQESRSTQGSMLS